MKIVISNTDIGALLKTTNEILKKYEKENGIPESIQGQVALSIIKKMTDRGYFDVCSVDNLADMNNIIIEGERYKLFRSLHCVHFDQMHQDTKEYVMACLIDTFKGNIVMAHAK